MPNHLRSFALAPALVIALAWILPACAKHDTIGGPDTSGLSPNNGTNPTAGTPYNPNQPGPYTNDTQSATTGTKKDPAGGAAPTPAPGSAP